MSTNGNASSNTLMNKTKKELVDIILRKDSVHKELNEKINALNSDLEKTIIERDNAYSEKKKINTKLCELDVANKIAKKEVENHRLSMEEFASISQKAKANAALWRNVALIDTILILLYFILHLIF